MDYYIKMVFDFKTIKKYIRFIFSFNLTCNFSRSQWPRDLKRRSAAARLLRLSVRISPGHGCLS